MHSLTLNSLKLHLSPSLSRTSSDAIKNIESASIQLKSRKGYLKNPIFFTTFNCIRSPDKPVSRISSNLNSPNSCLTINETPLQTLTVAEKVHCLASEFKSLSEPIERVKRLLHYATLLPPFNESARVEENRVMGCTTMVWLEAEMDIDKLMRFKVDSDSEITKGFCSCLIWLFDGAVPEEVLSIKTDDLVEMNVGMPSRGHSRVNTWHNILSSMQKKAKNFVEVRDKDRSLIDFPPLVASPDAISISGSHEEAQLWNRCLNKYTRKRRPQSASPHKSRSRVGLSFQVNLYADYLQPKNKIPNNSRGSRISMYKQGLHAAHWMS